MGDSLIQLLQKSTRFGVFYLFVHHDINNAAFLYDLKQISLPSSSLVFHMCNDTDFLPISWKHTDHLKKSILLLIFWEASVQVSLIKIAKQCAGSILARIYSENCIWREVIQLMYCRTSEKESLMTKVFRKEPWQWWRMVNLLCLEEIVCWQAQECRRVQSVLEWVNKLCGIYQTLTVEVKPRKFQKSMQIIAQSLLLLFERTGLGLSSAFLILRSSTSVL